MQTKRQPIERRSAWRPSDFSNQDAYSFTLSEAHFAAFDEGAGGKSRRPPRHGGHHPSGFRPRPHCGRCRRLAR